MTAIAANPVAGGQSNGGVGYVFDIVYDWKLTKESWRPSFDRRHARILVSRTPRHVVIRVTVRTRLGARVRSMGDGEAAMAILSGLDRRLR